MTRHALRYLAAAFVGMAGGMALAFGVLAALIALLRWIERETEGGWV